MQYAAPDWTDKMDTSKPQLMSQLVGDFNFGECEQVKEVRNDPWTYFFTVKSIHLRHVSRMLIKTPTRPRKELPPLLRDPKGGVGAQLEHAVRIVAKKKLSRSRDPELACHERRPDH